MYKTTIGLEIHAELNTNTKAFSTGKNLGNDDINNNLSVVDMGFPGVLPKLNIEAYKKALKTAIALNCDIPSYLYFDRKNYFYPDLPKGYQITQSHDPIGLNGFLTINNDKVVTLQDIHLEEDTANLIHYENNTLINYNRAGVPLIEIVTNPCLENVEEVLSFLDYLRKTLIYLNVSEAKLERGQMRCDVNISLRKETDTVLGTKVEIKNVNTWANIKDAINYEIERQTKILNNNEHVLQETRRFDETKRETVSMRSKEDAIDYRYFIEPNIPKIKISEDLINELKSTIPTLPYEKYRTYTKVYNLTEVETNTLTKEKEISDYFDSCITLLNEPKTISNWICGIIMSYMNKTNKKISDIYITPKMLVDLITLLNSNSITSKQAKEVLNKSLEGNINPKELIEKQNITQVSDEETLRAMIINIITNNPQMVQKYKDGRNVLDFFIGSVMKETKGTANPSITSNIVKEELNKLN